MSEGRIGFQKRFIEGQGYVVEQRQPGAGQAAAPVNAKPAVAVAAPPSSITREQLEKLAEGLNLVVVEVADYQDMLARISELEAQLSHQAQAAGNAGDPAPPAAPTTKPTGKGKKNAKTKTDDTADTPLAEQIKAAADLDALTALMKDVDDKDLLALADERAEQLKAGGPA